MSARITFKPALLIAALATAAWLLSVPVYHPAARATLAVFGLTFTAAWSVLAGLRNWSK